MSSGSDIRRLPVASWRRFGETSPIDRTAIIPQRQGVQSVYTPAGRNHPKQRTTRPGPGFVAGGLLMLLTAVALVNPRMATADDADKADQLRKDLRRMIETARDRVFPALVNIHVSTIDYWGGKELKGASV